MDVLEGLRQLPDESVDCCVTSPPYWGLRDYKVAGMIGLEASPEEHIARLVEVFGEVRRVLKKSGTCWINYGDAYAGNGAAYGSTKSTLNGRKQGETEMGMARRKQKIGSGLKPKDLIGLPWMLALALRADGWYLRNEIIWHKRNCMPESVTDRFTKNHEQIFLFTRSPKYYFNQEAVAEPCSESTHARMSQDIEKQIGSYRAAGGGKNNGPMKSFGGKFRQEVPNRNPRPGVDTRGGNQGSGGIPYRKQGNHQDGVKNNATWQQTQFIRQDMRNRRTVWSISNVGFSEAHFATFPPEIPRLCILAGCPPPWHSPRSIHGRWHERPGRRRPGPNLHRLRTKPRLLRDCRETIAQ